MNRTASLPQPLVGIALAAGAGICLAEWSRPFSIGVLCALVAAGAIASLSRPRIFCTYALVAAFFFALHLAQLADAPGRKLAEQLGVRPRPVVVTGEVVTEPKIGNGAFANFELRLDSIEIGGVKEGCAATIRVRWKTAPELGDEIRLTGLADPIPSTRNPGAFDMRAYLARRDIFTSVFVRYAEAGEIVRPRAGNFILRLATRSRDWMRTTLARGLEDSPDVSALINGMTLGLRHETPDDIEQPFQQTGTLHLFAVAGLHVGMIAELLWILARIARLPRKAAAFVIILVLYFYSAITGLHVSSLRAATMAAVLLGGIFFERPVFSLNSLAAAALLILAWDPNQLFTSGFQLSFAVVATIILCQRAIFRPLVRLSATDPFLPRSLVSKNRRALERGWRYLAGAVAVSAAAWIGSLPFIWWYYYLITPVSLLANLAIVPVAFCILAVAMMSLLAAPFSAALSVVFNNANWSLSRLVLALAQTLAQLPGGHVYVERPHWPGGARAEITVLDAGAGAAVHLRAGGEDWLFDCGSARDYGSFTRDYLHSRGIDRLDGLLLSHGDSLHIGGALALLDDFHPRTVFDNAAPDRSRIHHALIVRLSQRQLLARGDQWQLAPNVRARVLFPPRDFKAKAADDEALVLQLEIDRKFRVLLVSDSGTQTEKTLLKQPNELRSDILIKGQHHSGEPGLIEFLDAVQPRLIVATSVDFPERERIPDDWAQTVRDRGIRLFRQDATGAVHLEFFDQDFRASGFVDQETFRSSSR